MAGSRDAAAGPRASGKPRRVGRGGRAAPRRTTCALLDSERLLSSHACVERLALNLPGYWVSCRLGASAPACKVLTGGWHHLCSIHWSGHQMQSTEAFRPCLRLPSPSPQSCLVLPKTEKRGTGGSSVSDSWLFSCSPITSIATLWGRGGAKGPRGRSASSPAAGTQQPRVRPPTEPERGGSL